MKKVDDGLRKIIKNPLESIGFILAVALILIGLYLFSPFFESTSGEPVHWIAQYGIGLFYLATGLPFIFHNNIRCPPCIYRSSTNLLFTGYFFTTLFILMSTGLRPPHFIWALVGTATALVVHLWVARRA